MCIAVAVSPDFETVAKHKYFTDNYKIPFRNAKIRYTGFPFPRFLLSIVDFLLIVICHSAPSSIGQLTMRHALTI